VVLVPGGVKQTAEHSENNKDIFNNLSNNNLSKYAEFDMFNKSIV